MEQKEVISQVTHKTKQMNSKIFVYTSTIKLISAFTKLNKKSNL
jgi:hypothetical protein